MFNSNITCTSREMMIGSLLWSAAAFRTRYWGENLVLNANGLEIYQIMLHIVTGWQSLPIHFLQESLIHGAMLLLLIWNNLKKHVKDYMNEMYIHTMIMYMTRCYKFIYTYMYLYIIYIFFYLQICMLIHLFISHNNVGSDDRFFWCLSQC